MFFNDFSFFSFMFSRKLRERVLLKNSCSIDHQHDKTIADHQPLTTANDKTIADHQPLTTANDKNDKTIADHQPLTTANDKTIRQWEDLLRRSAEKICWEDLLRRSAEKICWENLLRENLLRRSAEKTCWRKSAAKICWEDLLQKSAEKICWEKICWEDLLRGSAEKICLRKSAEKICWEDLLKKSAEKICWEWLWIKTSLKFLSFFTQGGFGRSRRETPDVQNCGEMRIFEIAAQPSRRFVLIGRPKLWWNANFWDRRATLSSFRAHRTSKTVVKCEFLRSPRNPLVTSWSSDVQNWGEMQIF